MKSKLSWMAGFLFFWQMAANPSPANAVTVPDFSFETPGIGSGSYQYNPSGGSWTFIGSSPNGSGLVGNGSLFANPNAPDGVQAAFVQEHGSVSQTISGFTPGATYTLNFFAAERPDNAQSWNVTVNGTVIASFNPGSSATSYSNYTAAFTATAATQTVAFAGTDLAGGDNTVFIDAVQIATNSPATVGNLSCEHLLNPMGIDARNPRLSWMLNSTNRGALQTAYQVLVASSPAILAQDTGDFWNSGIVFTNQSVLVPYRGQTLTSGEVCYWKVRIWDQNGNDSDWSTTAMWSMGLLNPSDWTAQWIGMKEDINLSPAPPSPMLRKTFSINKSVARATAYICGLGYYELQINGAKVGAQVLDPAYTRYDYHAYYGTYDVTTNLIQGPNAVGVQLANGFYNQWANDEWNTYYAPWRALPQLRFQLVVQYTDGTSNVIISDSSWKVSAGPLVLDTTRLGEVYNAQLEQPGWSTSGFDDLAWTNAIAREGIAGSLLAPDSQPIQVFQTVSPVRIIPVTGQSGAYTFDFGQNLAGWGQLTVSGPAGTSVKMVYGELTNSDNSVNQTNINGLVCLNQMADLKPYFQADTYILKGVGTETYAPRFTYHGFRYAEVTGLPSAPTTNTLVAQVVHTAFNPAGSFSCSSDLLNRIETNAIWSYLGNFVGIPTDCPHREKNGWVADAQLACEMGLTHFDSAAAYTRWLKEFGPAQLPSGELFGVLPNADWGPGSGPGFEGAVLLVPWYVYQHTGDIGILTNNYSAMKAYVNYETSVATNNIVSYGLSDPSPANTITPVAVTDTTYYYQTALILAQTAALMGNTADSVTYSNLAAQISASFNSSFYNAASAEYSIGSQTAQSCALYQGLANSNQIPAVAGDLAATVQQNGNRVDIGAFGSKSLLRALCDDGHSDTAMAVALQTNYPSWGYQVSQGATTLWETWNGAGSFDSHNHIFFGDISAWFMEYVAGIRPGKPGYQSVLIKPEITGAIAWAQATHNSPYGTISNAWQINGQSITMSVLIPPNSTGLVYLPTLGTAATNLIIQESGLTIWTNGASTGSDAGVVYSHAEGSGAQTYSVWNVPSGAYQFNWTIIPTPTGLSARAGNGLVSLTWNPPGAAGYQVKRSTVSGGPYAVVANPIAASDTDLAVTNGNTYFYVVSAVNGAVESANSSEVSASPAPVPNFGFETPVVGAGAYQYNSSGGSWNFSGYPGNGSGIVGNGSAFFNPNAPQGVQAAFIQEYGTLSQTLNGFVPGTNYTIAYSAAQRPGSSQSWNVMIDNTVIKMNHPGSTSYTTDTATFIATAASQTLAFVGTDLAGGDNTVFIDNVQITPPLQPGIFSVMNPAPVLGGIQWQSGPQELSISGTAQPGQPCILVSATNLVPPVTWTPVMTNLPDASGNVSFTNIPAAGGQMFYRISGN